MRALAQMKRYDVSAEYPGSWYFAPKTIPKLVIPHELFAVSNRPIGIVPRSTSQPRPMIAWLDSAAIFIWVYYQAPGEPTPDLDGGIPDYRDFSYPLRYEQAQAFAGHNAREWAAEQFVWKRLGWGSADAQMTVWIWEGTSASPSDVWAARVIVESIRVKSSRRAAA